jgi:AcrR family transcriptional regulator
MAPRNRAEMVEQTKYMLIKTARKAFATKGFAAASMDNLTADAGLTRGALYHNFGDKKGLLRAVIDQIDTEIVARLITAHDQAPTPWQGLMDENIAFIKMALEPEIQRIMLLDGPAVLGDPSQWPNQTGCLRRTSQSIRQLIADGVVKPVNPEVTARLINGAALSAALWVATEDASHTVLENAIESFRVLMTGLLCHSH